jgi:hypothetical protein
VTAGAETSGGPSSDARRRRFNRPLQHRRRLAGHRARVAAALALKGAHLRQRPCARKHPEQHHRLGAHVASGCARAHRLFGRAPGPADAGEQGERSHDHECKREFGFGHRPLPENTRNKRDMSGQCSGAGLKIPGVCAGFARQRDGQSIVFIARRSQRTSSQTERARCRRTSDPLGARSLELFELTFSSFVANVCRSAVDDHHLKRRR